jgi:hypothetical protein
MFRKAAPYGAAVGTFLDPTTEVHGVGYLAFFSVFLRGFLFLNMRQKVPSGTQCQARFLSFPYGVIAKILSA